MISDNARTSLFGRVVHAAYYGSRKLSTLEAMNTKLYT